MSTLGLSHDDPLWLSRLWLSCDYLFLLTHNTAVELASLKHLRTKVTPDLHLIHVYSKNWGNLGSESI